MKVLLVEDNPLNQELMCDLLESRGASVTVASDAEEGIALAARESPDLILMDVSLPGVDGLTATRRLKDNPATASIPVIAVTAHAMSGDREKVESAGCSGYITKPIDVRTFVDEVRRYLPQPS